MEQAESEVRPVVVKPPDLAEPPGQQTPGIRRQQAFAGEDRWVGYVRTEPGTWSGWHHHGDNDTYLHVLRGVLELQYGTDGAVVRLGPGDFGHVPPGLVHRERTPPGEAGELVLVRFGRGPAVVNVDEAPARPSAPSQSTTNTSST